jgi:hypothetical protein
MRIPLVEPTAPRYIHINPQTNKVHVLMPVVSGTTIGLDNTCKSVYSLAEFFGKSANAKQVTALSELTRYKECLEFDIRIIPEESELKQQKQDRLKQINEYLKLLETVEKSGVLNSLTQVFPEYPSPLATLLEEKRSNLYSMVLRPKENDNFIRTKHRVFSVKREGESVFYQALQDGYQHLVITDARTRLTNTILASLEGQGVDFATIQQQVLEKTKAQFGLEIDFSKTPDGKTSVDKAMIDAQMMFDEETPPNAKDYIDALLGNCAPTLFDSLIESPFYTIKNAEELSLLTQFFLGQVNIYCAAHKLSPVNFAEILESSPDLSNEVAARVFSAYIGDVSIEEALVDFINEHVAELQMSRPLSAAEEAHFKKQFLAHYNEIKETPHFDEFIVINTDNPGTFVVHQGTIGTNFCEFMAQGFENTHFIQQRCKEFEAMNGTIPHHNAWVQASMDLDVNQIDDNQLSFLLDKLPKANLQELSQAYPARVARVQLSKDVPEFLLNVARGQQKEAEQLLKKNPEASQYLLLAIQKFTDYSGRTFNCSAYEYAYWAKDKHMCRMLEKYMDEATKAQMLQRVEAIEQVGLRYEHDKKVIEHSKHFDFTPLKTALSEYVQGYTAWEDEKNWAAMEASWMKVGMAQRDVPVHVAQEYCYPNRSFSPRPSFNEDVLPRRLIFTNFITGDEQNWFPLVISDSSGLGVDFGVGGCARRVGLPRGGSKHFVDLAAISHLDEVRTADLTQSRENLRLIEPGIGLAMPF